MLTYNLGYRLAGKKVEPLKKSGTFGRSCRVCKLYFLTSDPNAYTCPWCLKGEKQKNLADFDYTSRGITLSTQMLVQEDV